METATSFVETSDMDEEGEQSFSNHNNNNNDSVAMKKNAFAGNEKRRRSSSLSSAVLKADAFEDASTSCLPQCVPTPPALENSSSFPPNDPQTPNTFRDASSCEAVQGLPPPPVATVVCSNVAADGGDEEEQSSGFAGARIPSRLINVPAAALSGHHHPTGATGGQSPVGSEERNDKRFVVDAHGCERASSGGNMSEEAHRSAGSCECILVHYPCGEEDEEEGAAADPVRPYTSARLVSVDDEEDDLATMSSSSGRRWDAARGPRRGNVDQSTSAESVVPRFHDPSVSLHPCPLPLQPRRSRSSSDTFSADGSFDDPPLHLAMSPWSFASNDESSRAASSVALGRCASDSHSSLFDSTPHVSPRGGRLIEFSSPVPPVQQPGDHRRRVPPAKGARHRTIPHASTLFPPDSPGSGGSSSLTPPSDQ